MQLGFQKADELADKLAAESIGFATVESVAKGFNLKPDKAQQLFDEVLKVAARAAWKGMEAVGALDNAKRRAAERNERLANDANRRHDAWKRATGNPF